MSFALMLKGSGARANRSKLMNSIPCSRLLGLIGLSLMVVACGQESPEQSIAVAGSETLDVTEAESVFTGRKFELITPSGVKIMESVLEWETLQALPANARRFAQPAQCATNVSKVFEMAGLAHYASPLVPGLLDDVERGGGLVKRLPKSSQAILDIIDRDFGGRLPVGTLIAGCLYSNCSGNSGDGHVAIVGDIDSAGAIKAYHNNWYRPDNEGGVWKDHMIPRDWYNQGFRRRWMATPWMNIFRDPPRVGKPYAMQVVVPAIDDLNPTDYYVTLAVPAEIWREVQRGDGWVLNEKGDQVRLGELD